MNHTLDANFCSRLEYAITGALQHPRSAAPRGFWCDGVSVDLPETRAAVEAFERSGELHGVAWLGQTGQDEYRLTLRFTGASKRALLRGEDLNPFLPEETSDDWMYLHPATKQIVVWLA